MPRLKILQRFRFFSSILWRFLEVADPLIVTEVVVLIQSSIVFYGRKHHEHFPAYIFLARFHFVNPQVRMCQQTK